MPKTAKPITAKKIPNKISSDLGIFSRTTNRIIIKRNKQSGTIARNASLNAVKNRAAHLFSVAQYLIFSVTEPSAFFVYTISGLIATIFPLINVALSLLYWTI